MKQCKKKYVVLTIGVLFFCFGCQASTDDYEPDTNFNWSKKKTNEQIHDQIKKKFTLSGWLSRYFKDPKAEKDAKEIIEKVLQACLDDVNNSRIVPRRMWSPKRTKRSADEQLYWQVKKFIKKRVEEINPHFAPLAEDIATSIIRKNKLIDCIGESLDNNINARINEIQQEQWAIQQGNTLPSAPEADCNLCGWQLKNPGRSFILNCGHEFCPECYQKAPLFCPICNIQSGDPVCPQCHTMCYRACPKCFMLIDLNRVTQVNYH